jgi:Cu(I)/Ag(I) efflux system protein CusF
MNPLSRLAMAAAFALSPVSLTVAHAANAVAESAAATAAEASMSEGEVRKVDKSAGKLTIKHGELKNLGMPPMTMVFRVQDPAMLGQVKAGDKIQFVADKVAGAFTVIKLELPMK